MSTVSSTKTTQQAAAPPEGAVRQHKISDLFSHLLF